MDESLRSIARAARGFMPDDEGMALHRAAVDGGAVGPIFEIGSYCGKSTVYLGAAARATQSVVFSLDHHRGSEEHQAGEEFHDPELADDAGRIDTLPEFRRTISSAGLDDVVIPVIGASATVARWWKTPLGMLFIDGGHSREAAHADYEGWAPHVLPGGLLVIHDVFERPEEGGRPPFEIFTRALASGAFAERSRTGSLRVLERVADGL